MKRVCFDASAALAFALQDDPNHAAAVGLIEALAAQEVALCAPALFAYECDSVIRLRIYRGDLNEEDADIVREIVDALAVQIEFDAADRARAFEMANQYDQPRAYDTAYAAHAEARDIELVTADAPFFAAVNGVKRPKSVAALSFVKLLK